MGWTLMFFIRSIMLGIGLAMDAFSVSLANGLNEPNIRKKRMCMIAGVFALFQAVMPIIGWICVHSIINYFKVIEMFIPWIALALLLIIGGKMLIEGLRNKEDEVKEIKLTYTTLIIQGIATSIDALSVGFTMVEYGVYKALVCVILIAIVTFIICMVGLIIGKKAGMKLANKATILGGLILIVIGLEIFIQSTI